MKPSLQTYYEEKVAPTLKDTLGLNNVNEVPRLEKIVVTSHCGRYLNDRKAAVEDTVEEISKITGQKPSVVFAKKSVANFKVREGEAVGARVTLRGRNMWEFLDRFINVTSPNVRDFRGFSPKSFDGRGNYAVGVSDQSIFPEIELDKIKRQIGFDIIMVTDTDDDHQARTLLEGLGYPFRKPHKEEAPAAAAATA
jgi:large subunit ribosomal protein L5